MLQDLYHNELTTKNPQVVEEINLFITELLKLGKQSVLILQAAENYPQEFLVQLYASIFHLYALAEKNQEVAIEFLQQAHKLIEKANDREKSLYYCMLEWAARRNYKAVELLQKHCYKWPSDITALKVTEFLFYCTGQKFHAKEFLALTSYCQPIFKNDPFFLSMHSFALELNEKYLEARDYAELAILEEEMNPWAHHTLTHVYIKLPEIKKGIEVIKKLSQIWPLFIDNICSHNFWHLGLLYMEQLDFGKAAEVYIDHGWLPNANSVSVDVDASAIFWRLDMEGVQLNDIWQKLADNVNGYAEFPTTPFICTQLCYALKKGGSSDALNHALGSIDKHVQKIEGQDKYVWSKIGLPLLHGSLQFAEGNYQKALEHFDPMIKEVGAVGGSDAQIDLFYQTYLQALIKNKRYQEAKTFLAWMTGGHPLTALQQKWLSDC